jgi:CRISPR-associated protein Cas2
VFVVLRVAAAPQHLRGYLSRFLVEIAAGTYVGTISRRVADSIWDRSVLATGAETDLVMVRSDSQSEQGYTMRMRSGRAYDVVDLDGLVLVSRTLDDGI